MRFEPPSQGYFDGHCHLLFAGRELHGAILHEAHTLADLSALIERFRLDNPTLAWLDLSAIDAGSSLASQLDRHALDQIAPDLPLVIHTSDHHSIVVNTAALSACGYSSMTPEVVGGRFDVDTQGVPNGWIHEYVAMSLIYAHQPQNTVEQDLAALIAAQHVLLEHSITGLLDAWIDPGMPEVYLAAVHSGQLHLNVNLAPRIKPESWREDLEFAKTVRTKVAALNSSQLACRTVKIFADGVHSSNTAHVLGDETTSSLWNFDELVKMATEADLAGFQLHIHACGDAAVRTAIDAIERVIETNSNWDRRPVIAHAEEVSDQDIPRLANLGIGVNMQPAWLSMDKPDWHPLRKLLDANVVVGFGSDWPVSSPDVTSALAHLREMGQENELWQLSAEEASAAYSASAAWQNWFA